MKSFPVPYARHLSVKTPTDTLDRKISQSLFALEQLSCANWSAFPYKPYAGFSLVSLNDGLFLNFKVTEKHCLGRYISDNSPVYKDSCIELFIDPLGNGVYYNFEFNCIGTMLLGCGTSRNDRETAPDHIASKIGRQASLGNQPIDIKAEFTWELRVTIPFDAFFKHEINTLIHQPFRFNVHKCGDETTTPHYLTWNPIKTERPDFHRPEYFRDAFIEES